MRPCGLYLLDRANFDKVYGPEVRAEIAQLVEIPAEPVDKQTVWAQRDRLEAAQVILSSWGMPPVDEKFLAAAPNLRAIFYGAGSIRGFATPALWAREVVVCSAAAMNAVPVAEYIVATVLLSLKRFWEHARLVRAQKKWTRLPVPGAYRSTVGLVSLGQIGKLVLERLRTFEVRLLVYSTSLTPAAAAKLGVEVAPLAEVFRQADVISLHTPALPETEGMITGAHLAAMKPGATFINTARGAVVREAEMIAVLQRRPDITAILDVTHPEPPAPSSPLYTLPNVVLTPHIAGSMDLECRRMGQGMADELKRYLAGQPLRWQVTRSQAANLA
jgi:phosphoglycerate dehydrogenase-like enzyme